MLYLRKQRKISDLRKDPPEFSQLTVDSVAVVFGRHVCNVGQSEDINELV